MKKDYIDCFAAKLPLCENCIESLAPYPWTYPRTPCALNFFAGNISGLKDTEPEEVRRVLIAMVKHNRYPKHIAYILKHMMPERYEWFQKLLVLI